MTSMVPLKPGTKVVMVSEYNKYLTGELFYDKMIEGNYGIIIGEPNGIVKNGVTYLLICFDVDNKNISIPDPLKKNTLVVETRKGFHVYFYVSEDVIKEVTDKNSEILNKDGNKVECWYRKRQIVGPGSIVDGHEYKIISDDDVSPQLADNFVFKFWRFYFKKSDKFCLSEGSRNETCMVLTRDALWDKDFTKDEAKEIMVYWNKMNKPPLDKDGVIATVNSATCFVEENPSKKRNIKSDLQDKINDWLDTKDIHSFDGTLFIYDSGIFIHTTVPLLAKAFENDNETQVNLGMFRERLLIKKACNQSFTKMFNPDKFSNILVCKDYCIDLGTCNRLEHSAEYRKTRKIDFNPVKLDAENPIMTAMNDFFTVDGELDEGNFSRCLEFDAYCLFDNNFLEKFCVNTGHGKNGKGTHGKILATLFGDSLLPKSLHDLLARFGLAGTEKAKIIQTGDMSKEKLTNTGLLKSVTSDDEQSIEYKGETPFRDSISAKIIINSNRMLQVSDDSKGFHRRVLAIEWKRDFNTDSINDEQIKTKLATLDSKFYDGYLYELVKVAQKLYSQGKFTCSQSLDEIEEIMFRSNNTLEAFETERLEYDADSKDTSLRDIYDAVDSFCRKYYLDKFKHLTVKKMLLDNGCHENNLGKKNIRCMMGVKITDRSKKQSNI